MMKLDFKKSLLLLVSALLACLAKAETLPQYSEDAHIGVATCASSVCHGSVRPRSSTSVSQNEYVVWSRLDTHKNAYSILLSEESYWIAKNLGLENAHEAQVCLDCHADNVATEKQGTRFQIEDGVGCEACHGGSERYLSSHTDPNRTHQQNVDDGLYPTDRLEERAKLCFSCHVGDEQKIASHEIMGAGHPRLSFELDTFGALQPAHYTLDDDYLSKKWSSDHVTIWALGQVEAGYQTLKLIEEHLSKDKLFPELSLFDCHSCHHPMSNLRWEQRAMVDLPPGSVRLNDAGFSMLSSIARVVLPRRADSLEQQIRGLHQATASKGDILRAASELSKTITQLKTAINRYESIEEQSDALLGDVVATGGAGGFRDYVAAEQAVMAVDLLMDSVVKRELNNEWLDQLYVSVEDEDIFDPYSFADVMRDNPF